MFPLVLVGPEKTRDITPNNNSLPIEVINNLISKERKSLREMIVQFLKDPELPIWDPPEYASDREYLASLQLPTYPDGGPCLLLHNLNECDPDEVKVFRGVHPLCVIITCASKHSHRMLQVHLQHIRVWKDPAHVESPHEDLGFLPCCNSR
jgi:hypothetical protein